jgi:hypothetical protein
MEHWRNDTDGKAEVPVEQPVPGLLCPTLIPNGLVWDQCGIFFGQSGTWTGSSPSTSATSAAMTSPIFLNTQR